MIHCFIGALLHYLIVVPAGAQFRPVSRTTVLPPSLVYYEAVNAPSATPGLSRIDILYRIDLSFFIPARDPSNPLFSEFIRKGEVQIELQDSTETTAARRIPKFEEPTTSTEVKPGTLWHTGMVSFDIVPGEYTISFAIEDLESERTVKERTRKVLARDFPTDKPAASSPLLVAPPGRVTGDSISIASICFGGGMRFGHDASLVLEIVNADSTNLTSAGLRVTRGSTGPDADSLVVSDEAVEPLILPGMTLLPKPGTPSFMIVRTERNSSVVILPFPAEKLPTGSHILEVTIGEITVTHPLPVIWPDMPRSLLNPVYAMDALRFITTTEELDSVNSGPEDERMKHFEDFWKAKDRTPETAFNEVMTEYYTRVDHAAANFGTLREPDGTWTDRGRIHVLYGTPTRVERNLDPAGFIEVWSYETARKKFIFLDETKTGNYVLTSTRPL